MNLIVRPHWRLAYLDLTVPHAIISITDPQPWGRYASIPQRPGLEAVGRWTFWDTTDAADALAMQPSHAAGIWRFVDQCKVDTFVVCCNAGASRSPSIAMAIADRLKLGRACIDGLGLHLEPPNQHVYGLMMDAGRKEER